ncbi:MAG: PQQ-binding-like beta-propeller repeat protein [Anaeromyxobacter sp.]
MKRLLLRRFLAVALITTLAVGSAVVLLALLPPSSLPSPLVTISWRMRLAVRKARGHVPNLSWRELLEMVKVKGGFGLKGFAIGAQSLEGALANPYVTPEDHEAGSAMFRDRCAMCHGGQGAGMHAPPLNRALKHGNSDMAIYRVLKYGIAGTAMVAQDLPMKQAWQLVGYIKMLQTETTSEEAAAASSRPPVSVDFGRLRAAAGNPDEWLTYSGTLDGRHHSPLAEITSKNVDRMRLLWTHQFEDTRPEIQATPLVVGGVIYTTLPPSTAVALDARTGEELWRYARPIPDVPLCCRRVNRGLAILGNKVYMAALDGYLVALDARTGALAWTTKVGDWSAGYSMTGAPLAVNDTVVVGIAGGEFGIRGYLTAYDAETGDQRWRFHTIPAPGEPGNETWAGDSWKTGGGPTWNVGAYDPTLDLVYWGVGNPGPDYNGDVRPGDNLYTDSVVAVRGATGKLAWHFQFTPHDEHDWDSTQVPILADLRRGETTTKAVCWANRNGFYYVLDRTTGKFLKGTPFVEQNWASGLTPAGRPIPLSSGTTVGQLVRPGGNGGTNWQNATYDEKRGLVFVHATEGAAVFTKAEETPRGAEGTAFLGSAGGNREPIYPFVRALDAGTGAKAWEYASPLWTDKGKTALYTGLLSTGGGVVFGASSGVFFALDADTGKERWRVSLGGNTMAPPITFRLDGRQVVLISAGSSLFMFGL